MKLLEDNITKTFSDIKFISFFLGQSPKAIEIKAKINKWDLIKLMSFCAAKETISKMKRLPRTERRCKWYNQQGPNFQNIQTAHTTQQQQNKQPDLKMAWKDAQHLNYYRNADPNYNEKPPHTGQNCCLVTKWYLTLLPPHGR